jgi:hypothetical protein
MDCQWITGIVLWVVETPLGCQEREFTEMMSKGVYAAAGLVAGLAVGVTGAAGAATSRPAKHECETVQPSGATWHVIPAGDSLAGWADVHAYGSGNVLSATITCGPGVTSLPLMRYLDRGDLHAVLGFRAGVWVPALDYRR